VSADLNHSRHSHELQPAHFGVFRAGTVELDRIVDWPDGQRVSVQLVDGCASLTCEGPVVIAGFGPAGRCVADLLDRRAIPYVVVDRNPRTIATQEDLGRRAVLGDVSEPAVLETADIRSARLLVLTIPDEKSTVRAIRSARLMNPSLVILARTEYISTALIARRAGASAVISAELAVAKEFHELLMVSLSGRVAEQSGAAAGHSGSSQ
jgi:voltage-gated potassium channel Kch